MDSTTPQFLQPLCELYCKVPVPLLDWLPDQLLCGAPLLAVGAAPVLTDVGAVRCASALPLDTLAVMSKLAANVQKLPRVDFIRLFAAMAFLLMPVFNTLAWIPPGFIQKNRLFCRR